VDESLLLSIQGFSISQLPANCDHYQEQNKRADRSTPLGHTEKKPKLNNCNAMQLIYECSETRLIVTLIS
jgi:hypothetical protein